MRKLLASFVLAFVAASVAVAQVNPVPRKAGEFVFNMADGKQLLLSSFQGKVTCMLFMYTTCPHCQDLAGKIGPLQKEYGPKGVQFVGAVFDEGAKEGLAQFNLMHAHSAFPVGWSDMNTVLAFLKHADPHYYVPMVAFVDRSGIVRSQYIGNEDFFNAPEQNIRVELDKLLAGKMISSLPKKK